MIFAKVAMYGLFLLFGTGIGATLVDYLRKE